MYIVGKVLKPQGIHGEVKVEIITSFPEQFTKLDELFIEKDLKWQACPLENARVMDRFAFLKFLNIDSVDAAAELKGKLLCIPAEKLKNLVGDEYYIHDLIGMKVVDELNRLRGEIVNVESYPANDVYTVREPDGNLIDIPAVKDFIIRVDVNQKIIYIREFERLLE